MEFSLDELRVYARCGLEWFWEKRAGIEKPQTIHDLLPEALRTALAFYYGGHAESLGVAVGLVWRDWCEGWGEAALASDLVQYARGRAGIGNRRLFSTVQDAPHCAFHADMAASHAPS